MKKLVLHTWIFFLVSFLAFAQKEPLLLPKPDFVQVGERSFPLENISLFVPKNAPDDISFAINELKSAVKERTGKYPKPALSSSQATFQYKIKETGHELPEVSEMSGSSEREWYQLTISSGKIQVEANTSTGLFYAVQTIRQLIQGDGKMTSLPAITIKDKPKIAYRGIMMDFAHGGLLTVDEIKKQIDFLAKWKTNQYYFYNEVSIELDGFPSLGYKTGYSKKEVSEIIAYGKQRHMDVIPFLNLYGHLHELLRNEKYADLSIGHYGHELDPRNPKVNALLTNWISQYTQLFQSPFIHVGFDETWETKRIADDGDIKISSEKLWLQQLDFVQAELKKYGKTVMTWTDMNNYYPEIIGKIPKDVIPVIWEYKPDTVEINRYLNPVLAEKRKFLIQPAVSGWGHIYPDARYTYTNIDLCLKAGIRNKTLGFINSVWTDPVEPSLRPSWLFMAYGSIGAWQGITADQNTFATDYAALTFPKVSNEMKSAFEFLQKSNEDLDKCLGRNTNGMPRGTIIESWANPFLPYYLSNTEKHLEGFKNARKNSEEAQSALTAALKKCNPNDVPFINSLLISARLMHYSASRFVWAKTICDRWNDSMLRKKKNDFVVYDITYLCHGLLVDMMDENGDLKTAYENAWKSEYKPYRLNTILGRFDVEHALWQKLQLKVNDYRIQNSPDHIASKSFEELFTPDF